jgi:hypothetical protein
MTNDRIALTLRAIRPDSQLHYENYQVVSIVQALLGAISANMAAISLECVGEDIHLHFWIERDSSDDRDMIREVAEDLFALQVTDVSIETHVSVGKPPLPLPGRPVYLKHEARNAG